jgi:hypothetical protein
MTMSCDEVEVKLKGLECWAVTYNQASGALICLGAKIARRKSIDNPHLSSEAQQFHPSHDLFLQCPWQVTTSNGAQIGDEGDGGGLPDLVGNLLINVRIDPSSYDGCATFSNGYQVIFQNAPDPDEYDSYSIMLPGIHWVVAPHAQPREETSNIERGST